MGREIQKKKRRSGLQKIRQKPKSKKVQLVKHPIIAANWDKTQTLSQNYKRLGLTSKLNKTTGGVERKAADLELEREEAERNDGVRRRKAGALNIVGSRRPEEFEVHEAKIERDPETGKILKVIEPRNARPNPLSDPLNDLESDDEREGLHGGFGEHADSHVDRTQDASVSTDVVKELQLAASRPAVKFKPRQSGNERAFIADLVAMYGDDYAKMARDMKINYMQRSEGDLKRRVKKWREAGGKVRLQD